MRPRRSAGCAPHRTGPSARRCWIKANLAGIGNLYKAEVLFLRGISPWRPVGTVDDLEAVVELARRLLEANKEHADQVTTGNPARGQQTWVYGRAGRPCRRCGTRGAGRRLCRPRYAVAGAGDILVPGLPARCEQLMSSDGHAAFVAANCGLRPVPEVPEISLYAADDAFSLWEAVEREVGQPDQPPPFWAFAWPGGQALARYVLDHREQVAGRRVLDLGSGSGLTAIACALAGASVVLASELDPFALAAIGLNAARMVSPSPSPATSSAARARTPTWYSPRTSGTSGGWRSGPLGLLQRARARGADVLIGDIGRAFLPRPLMRQLASYEVPVIADLEGTAVKRVLILTLS